MKKNKASLKSKIYRKLHWILFSKIKPGKWITFFYASYRHRKKSPKSEANQRTVYITQVPNEGAGIGHQIANYNGGYHYSELFGIPHAYSPFKDASWNQFLGFGEGEVSVKELMHKGYKKRLLPYFTESEDNLSMIKEIIHSYSGEKVILCVELDQFYQKQYEVIPHIKEKFEHAKARKSDQLLYQPGRINMAVHIRRGDIEIGQVNGKESLTKRWLNMEYYENIVSQVTKIVGDRLDIYIFSQGDEESFRMFEKYGKVIYCLDMSAQQSFLHMVRADILVISKSSFSYKPALLSDGIRICPKDFWHGYPDNEQWIVTQEDGTMDDDIIKIVKSNLYSHAF